MLLTLLLKETEVYKKVRAQREEEEREMAGALTTPSFTKGGKMIDVRVCAGTRHCISSPSRCRVLAAL